jgi:hypothetical protein
MELDVAELDGLPELSHLQLHLHEQTLVIVVRVGEHRPRRAPTGLLDDALDNRWRATAVLKATTWLQ